MSDVTPEDLAEFDEDFGSASGEGGTHEPVKDGTYTVDVEAVELKRTKNTDRPMLAWMLRIVSPGNAGRVLFRNNVIATGKNMEYLKKDLYLCGLVIAKLSELPDHLEQLLDLRIKVRKVTKGEYENVYFQELVSAEPEVVEEEGYFGGQDMPPAGPDDDSYPF